MKKLSIPSILLAALLPACGGGGEEAKTMSADTSSTVALKLAVAKTNDHHTKPNSYESTSVNTVPAEALDHPFTYLMNRMISREDQRLYLYTVIPHSTDYTYALDHEKLDGKEWNLYFKQFASQGLAKGLFVHTIYQIPKTMEGGDVTDIQVHIVDAAGNVLDDAAGVVKKPKRPLHVRVSDKHDVDPNYPTEDVTIYLNGGKDAGIEAICGFAYVYELGDAVTMTDDTGTNTVEFTLTATGTPTEFIYFDHEITAFGANAVKAVFPDSDGDATTLPRWTVYVP